MVVKDMMNNILKIFALIIGTLMIFIITHAISHKISMKSVAKFEAKYNQGFRDKNRDIVRHGFLQHHIHDGSGNVLWQKPSNPDLVVQEETE